MERFLLLTALLLITVGSCHSRQCTNVSIGFQTNLKTLFVLLAKNAPLHDGFYETMVGNNSDKVYGVGQCRANISASGCSKCLEETIPPNNCTESKERATLSTLCTSKFSHKNFFGVWDNFSSASYADGFDKPSVFSKGYSMMNGLASKVPSQPLMYQTTVIDVGETGKRYGLAQCSRDLSKSNCQNCLEDRLVRYRSFLQNRTGWEILGVSCSMWYSNMSVIPSSLIAPTPVQSQLPPTPPQSRLSPTPPQSQLPRGNATDISGARGRSNGEFQIGLTTLTLLAFQASFHRIS